VAVPAAWKLAQPGGSAIQTAWWQVFRDPELSRLEEQATSANQSVQAAIGRVDESRAIARVSAARFSPQAGFDPSINRFRTQANHIPSQLTATATTVPLDFSYEIDLWGKIRRSFEASRALADASAADMYQVLLTVNGDVAIDYFLLRQADSEIGILQRTLALRQKTVDLVSQRFNSGMVPELDVHRARTDYDLANTALIEMQRKRTNLKIALALLCGQPSPSFQIASDSLRATIPEVPAGLPSELLERRPDIASAERKMAAANAEVGVAKAAFFPAISLTGNAGYSSFQTATLLAWESRLFQVGPGVSLPILNGGRLSATLKAAHAKYWSECANYREKVLTAFKEVSDSLEDLSSYGREAQSTGDAVTSASKAAASAEERYGQGLIPFVDVLDAQRTELQVELQKTQIGSLRLVSTVHLIKALGGGFNLRR
jgi:multidrug efflux system outer membrane protein